MRLPEVNIGGTATMGTVKNKGPEIRAAYNTLAQGANSIAQTLGNIERDRLDQEAVDEAFKYDVDKLNFEAEQYSKTEYSPDDPALEGLDNIKKTEVQIIDGVEQEVPRQSIPADEVWPDLFNRYNKDAITNASARITSPERRTKFEQQETVKAGGEQVSMIMKTTAAQYKRINQKREQMIATYRAVGTQTSRDKIQNLIDTTPDEVERGRLQDWWATTKEIDENSEIITGAMATRNVDTLTAGYQEYLAFADGTKEYTGNLTKPELEQQAHTYLSHLNQVNTLNAADGKMNLAYLKDQLRYQTANAEKGLPANDAELAATTANANFALSQDKDNEGLVAAISKHDRANVARNEFRDIITQPPADGETVYNSIERWRNDVYADITNMSEYDRNVAEKLDGMAQQFITSMQGDPMQTLQNYGLAVNPNAPVTPINMADTKDLGANLAIREFAYDYYKGIYGYTGDILSSNERGQFNGVLEDDTLPMGDKLAYMFQVAAGTTKYEAKLWGPSINDKTAGRYAAMGQLLIDYATIGAESQGTNIAKTVMRGQALYSADPTMVEDYRYIRSAARSAFGSSYSNFPGVADAYMDNAMAYAVATTTKGTLTSSDLRVALDIVSGGMIDMGKGRFLTPAAGLNQSGWNEWLNEVDTSYMPDAIGWTKAQLRSDIDEGNITLQPTGASRISFFMLDKTGKAIMNKNGTAAVFQYDASAPRRYVP